MTPFSMAHFKTISTFRFERKLAGSDLRKAGAESKSPMPSVPSVRSWPRSTRPSLHPANA
jgi:hypothetical protein